MIVRSPPSRLAVMANAPVETKTCNSPANNACPPTVPLSMMIYSTSNPCFWNVLVSSVAQTAALPQQQPVQPPQPQQNQQQQAQPHRLKAKRCERGPSPAGRPVPGAFQCVEHGVLRTGPLSVQTLHEVNLIPQSFVGAIKKAATEAAFENLIGTDRIVTWMAA